MKNQVIIVTGANAGIGLETAVELAQADGTIILACRNKERGEKALEEIKKRSGSKQVWFMQLDLANFDSIRKFSADFIAKYQTLDILINNAGIHTMTYEKTQDGFESVFGVNFLGGAYLTECLLDVLKNTPNSRIINVSSRRHAECKEKLDFNTINDAPISNNLFRGLDMYRKSKLAQISWSIEFQKQKLNSEMVQIVNLHPGVCRTQIIQSAKSHSTLIALLYYLFFPIIWFLTQDCLWGAQTTLYCCYIEFKKLLPGGYYQDCRLQSCSSLALNEDFRQDVWRYAEKVLPKIKISK